MSEKGGRTAGVVYYLDVEGLASDESTRVESGVGAWSSECGLGDLEGESSWLV